ncbi:MAG: hypothetical protein JWQ87_4806 [Candidatus Sulfotelmatobacter sp.]|nr:hypothetical protein [Candidatus Sulfotelmatobacter sp.]
MKKMKKQSASATLAEVAGEMAKPRVASSAREYSQIFGRTSRVSGRRVVKNNVEKRTVDFQPTVVMDKA